MPVPTLTEIAAHLGISIPRAHQLKAKGMPINTLKAALLWRESTAKKREATNKKRAAAIVQGRAGRPRKIVRNKPANTDDSLKDSLTDAITIERDAFEAYQDAKMARSPDMSARLSEFNKALQGRQNAERLYREENQVRNLLVPKTTITELCRRCMDTVLRRLKKLPGEQGPQCNPQDPLMAVRILEREVNEIITAGHAALGTL